MDSARRIYNFITGLLMVFLSGIMIYDRAEGYLAVLFCLECSLFLYGIRQIWYYLTMARHMVGGILVFYRGLFFLDAGVFTLNLDDVPRIYAMIYLLAGLAFSGIIDMLQANSARKLQSGHWKYQMFYGVVKVGFTVLSVFFINSVLMLTIIYSAGLLHAAVSRIVTAFRRTAIVYVE